MSLKIAIIGRPNVGKSTLFNRLAGKRMALVSSKPGMTRDRRETSGSIADLDFTMIDTAGLEEVEKDALKTEMMKQTKKAVDLADVALMLIDGREGVTPMDEYFADWARKQKKPIILVVNKCEGKNTEANAIEGYSLGMGDPLIISAEHGIGMQQLYEALKEYETNEGEEEEVTEEQEENGSFSMTIIGRPNAGKSTLLNQLVGDERSIVGAQAGTTRDSISEKIQFDGREIEIIDTAGMRKKSNVTEKEEWLSVNDAKNSVNFTHVVVLLLDGNLGLEKQDLTIADNALKEGRGLVVAVNKWDQIRHKNKTLEDIKHRLEKSLSQIVGVPVVPISALKGDKVTKVLEEAAKVYDTWNVRIGTGQLNKWLEYMQEKHSAPQVGGRRVKIRYMTQVNNRPPSFALFTNRVKDFPESYLRYLTNGLREEFDLWGVPLRVFPRKGDNPYKKEG